MLQPIETAPVNQTILATDGKWWAVVVVYGEPDYDQRTVRINHWAVSQEYDWHPTHWAPMPSAEK